MKNALHFGAGKIGRGFIGPLLSQAGYDVCFADANRLLVEEINRRQRYVVHILDTVCEDVVIRHVSAVAVGDADVIRHIVEADLITTAVSMGVLPGIAPVLAAGLKARCAAGVTKPLNIIACENGVRATSRLKAFVHESLDGRTIAWSEGVVGFADSSVDRIVPPVSFPEPLDVAAEAFHEWNVERAALAGEPPRIKGMHLTDTLEAHIERKLYTLNTGHCAAAYLGRMKRCVTIAEALADERIFELVKQVMWQSGEVLIRKFGFGRAAHAAYIDSVLRRFRNPALKDTVARVGRDPIRKLSAPLYFSCPIAMAAAYGLPVDKLALAAAAVLHFDEPSDPQCGRIRTTLAGCGVRETFRRFTGLEDEAVLDQLVRAYDMVGRIVNG